MLTLNLNILWTFIDLALIYFVLKRFLFKPVNEIIKKREDIINTSLDNAKKAEKDAESLKKSYEETISNVKAEADEIIEKAQKRAKKEYNSIIDTAKNDAEIIIKNEEKSMNDEKQKALRELQLNTTDFVIMAAEKIAEKSIDDDNNRRMIDAFISEAGEAH